MYAGLELLAEVSWRDGVAQRKTGGLLRIQDTSSSVQSHASPVASSQEWMLTDRCCI
jgi:hypothetical protein